MGDGTTCCSGLVDRVDSSIRGGALSSPPVNVTLECPPSSTVLSTAGQLEVLTSGPTICGDFNISRLMLFRNDTRLVNGEYLTSVTYWVKGRLVSSNDLLAVQRVVYSSFGGNPVQPPLMPDNCKRPAGINVENRMDARFFPTSLCISRGSGPGEVLAMFVDHEESDKSAIFFIGVAAVSLSTGRVHLDSVVTKNGEVVVQSALLYVVVDPLSGGYIIMAHRLGFVIGMSNFSVGLGKPIPLFRFK